MRKVCAHFVELCRKLGLLTKASVAIDGGKFKAVNDRGKNVTRNKVDRRRKQLEEGVVETIEKQMLASQDQQISLTDHYSRSMAASGRGADIGVESLVIKDPQNILQNGHGRPMSQYAVNHTVKSARDLLATMSRMDYVVSCRFNGVIFHIC